MNETWKPLWLLRLEKYQKDNDLSDNAIDKALGANNSGLIRKAKARGGNINLNTLYQLASIMHISPRKLVDRYNPLRAIRQRSVKERMIR